MQCVAINTGDPKSHTNFGIDVDVSPRSLSSPGENDEYDIVVGASLATGIASVTGAAYVFRSSAAQWTQHTKLFAWDGVGDERFGLAVAIYGPYIAVGAPEDRSQGTDSGSAYVFELTESDRYVRNIYAPPNIGESRIMYFFHV